MNLQRARVLLGERGQEDVGKVDEKGADGLLGRVKKPGREETGLVGSISFKLSYFVCLIIKVRFFRNRREILTRSSRAA